jgi:hypothetical protein
MRAKRAAMIGSERGNLLSRRGVELNRRTCGRRTNQYRANVGSVWNGSSGVWYDDRWGGGLKTGCRAAVQS